MARLVLASRLCGLLLISPPLFDGTCNNCDLVSFGGLWGPSPFVMGGGERIRAVPTTNASSSGLFGAPLVAAPFNPRAVRYTNASLLDSLGAILVAATFHLRAVRGANASPSGFVGTPLLAASFLIRAVRNANAAPLPTVIIMIVLMATVALIVVVIIVVVPVAVVDNDAMPGPHRSLRCRLSPSLLS